MADLSKSAVGDVKKALAGLTGIDPASIEHYVIGMDTEDGIVLGYCCDDRERVAAMFRGASRLVMMPEEETAGG